MVEPERQQITI